MYELMILVNPSSTLDKAIGSVEKTLKEAQGENILVSKIGKKVLAYPIAKQMEAEYVLLTFNAPPEAVNSISLRLKVENEVILRYIIVRAAEIKKDAKIGKKVAIVVEKPKVTVKTVTKTGKSAPDKKEVKSSKKVVKKVSAMKKEVKKGKKK